MAAIQPITIRDLQSHDASWLYALMNHPTVMRYVPDRFGSLQEMREVVAWLIGNYTADQWVRLTYVIKSLQVAVGWISLGPLPSEELKTELAYVVHPDHWGRGIAGAAVGMFLDSFTAAKSLEVLWAEVAVGNRASIRILERHGFSHVREIVSETGERKYLYRR